MKITIIVGSRFHSLDLARELTQHGHQVKLVTFYPRFKIKQFGITSVSISSIPVLEYFSRIYKIIFGRFPNNFWISKIFGTWASKVIPMDSDIYICWASYGMESMRKIRKKNKDAKIIIERGSAHILEQDRILNSLPSGSPIDRRIIQRELEEYDIADYISIPGKFSKSTYLKQGIPEKKLFINHYGVALDGFYPGKTNRNQGPLILGYAGYLSARKNIEGLIRAVSIVNKNSIRVKLHLIGTIDNSSFNRKLLDSHDFITYHPPVPQKELLKFYHNIDVFVLNSIEDGFGMVLLQALACGLPVIATDHSGGPDVIVPDKNGLIVPAGNTDSLILAIERLLDEDGFLEKMRRNVEKPLEKEFSWKAYGNRYDAFLNEIVK